MQGYVQVYTGDGKGKTTAASGLALRAAGAGLKTYVGQFIKSDEYCEVIALERFSDLITLEQFGRGYFIRGEPCDEDLQAAAKALKSISAAFTSGSYDLVVTDEANVAFMSGLVSDEDILSLIEVRPAHVERVLTGRGAPPVVMERADLVSEMKPIKHDFEQGVLARKGIES